MFTNKTKPLCFVWKVIIRMFTWMNLLLGKQNRELP